MPSSTNRQRLLSQVCADLGVPPADVSSPRTLEESARVWRGPLDIDALAVTLVSVATHLSAQLMEFRTGDAFTPRIDATCAALSFLTEGLATPLGWDMPPVWDAIAGDYRGSDGWFRLHTNYPHHRTAALKALGIEDTAGLTRRVVEDAARSLSAEAVEAMVADTGGVASCQRSCEQWLEHPQGRAVRAEPLLHRSTQPAVNAAALRANPPLPFSDVRVVDLTRVLAGPVATGYLASWGAQVLRVDPFGFEEVASVVPFTTAGKRTTRLDLTTPEGRKSLLDLVAEAHVVVHGYRSGALEKLGLGIEQLRSRNPDLIVASLNAYGTSGPWSHRRGFDSIVQHSLGITSLGQDLAAADEPVPLPCQALDHGTGWLIAAAVAKGLLDLVQFGQVSTFRASLARTGMALLDLEERIRWFDAPIDAMAAPYLVEAASFHGPLRRLPWPGRINDLEPQLGFAPGIGAGPPTW